MANVVTAYNNFARGKIDHDMMGRFDLPIYRSGSDVFENFFSNFKGNAIYRAGLEDVIGEFQDCVFHEFLFRNDQNYIMVFFNTKVRFLTYASDGTFGFVESSPSVILEVTTPWTLEQARTLQFTQNGDVTVATHPAVAPQDIIRTSATNFTVGAHTTTGVNFGTGFPESCLFYKNRLYFANTASNTTTIWGSEAGDFNNFDITGGITDISPLQFTLSDIAQPIEWLFGGENSLLVGCADGIVAVNGGDVGVAITAETIEADLTPTNGSNGSMPFSKDGLVFYVGKNDRNMYYFSFDLLTESFEAIDANFISYDISRTGIGKVRHKKDRDDLIYGVRGDGAFLSLNFNRKENIIGWHDHKTNGLVKDIAVITDNDGNPQLFTLTDRDGSFFIERQAELVEFSERSQFFTNDEEADDEAHNRKVAQELTECNYLDNSLKLSNLQEANTITFGLGVTTAFGLGFGLGFGSGFGAGTITAANPVFSSGDVGKHISYKTITGYESGRFIITNFQSTTVVDVDILQTPTSITHDDWYLSFDTLSGLTQYIGQEIGAVTDGGFLDLFDIDSDTLELGSQVLTVVVGLTYRGLIKSFSLGFQVNAENTQTTMKAVSRVGMRTVSSAGGKFGTTPYRLEPLQELSQNDINYLPPLPLDGTKYLTYVDENEIDKEFFVVQDEPLPLILTSIMIDANYTIRQ